MTKTEVPLTLHRSVITSSSDRDLKEFVTEIRALVGSDVFFDFMLLRETDWVDIFGKSKPESINEKPERPNLTALMATEKDFKTIEKWAIETLTSVKATISAIATYFPDLSSGYTDQLTLAARAIKNCVKLSLRFVETGISESAIVEIVCGTILDRCLCDACQEDARTFVFSRKVKICYLVQSLIQVVREVKFEQRNGKLFDAPFAIGIELEPGEIYVINSSSALASFFKELDHADELLPNESDDQQVLRKGDLKSTIGLNLDIAHMRIAGVSSQDLEPLTQRIVHSHISDHPWMHTRDQVVGQWTSVDRHRNGYRDYIDLLLKRKRELQNTQRGLPFSGAIALELEGCNRFRWVVAGLTAIKQLTESARNYPASEVSE